MRATLPLALLAVLAAAFAACGGGTSHPPLPTRAASVSSPSAPGAAPGSSTATATAPAATSPATSPVASESATPTAGTAAGQTSNPTPVPPTETPVPAPTGPAFYLPPEPLPAGSPGTIIRAEPAPAPPGAVAWKVLYHSRAVDGSDIAVSGYVVAPTATPPAGGFPVLAWAHGTTGIANQCAPTRMGTPADEIPYLADFIARGFVVAATDYEGLGTPGVHPYAVGASEAHSLLDSVRAAENLPAAHAGTRVLAFGQSQGGHAVLETGELAASYAPDLQLLGVLAGGPLTELSTIVGVLEKTPYFGYLFMAGAGFDAAYHTHILDDVLTPEGRASLSILQTGCVDQILARYAGVAPATLLAIDPLQDPDVKRLAEANTPGNARSSAPILILHGGADAQIPPILSTLYTQRACKTGSTVELRFFPGLGHTGPVDSQEPLIMQWLADRLAGKPPASSCGNVPNPP